MATTTVKPKKPAATARAAHYRKPLRPPSAREKSTTKMTDHKGRVGLGGRFANRAVIVERVSETEMVIKLARVIPESEAWLYNNAEALATVRTGLAQARAGEVTKGPNLIADAKLIARLRD